MKINTTSYGAKIIFPILLLIPVIGFYQFDLILISFLFSLIILLILATFSGIEFDKKAQKYRHYTSYFGFKKGDWKDLKDYVGIIIISGNGSKQVYGGNLAISHSKRQEIHNVFLVKKNHRKKIKLTSKPNSLFAKKFAKWASEKLDIPIVKYNPPRSEQTLNRRKTK